MAVGSETTDQIRKKSADTYSKRKRRSIRNMCQIITRAYNVAKKWHIVDMPDDEKELLQFENVNLLLRSSGGRRLAFNPDKLLLLYKYSKLSILELCHVWCDGAVIKYNEQLKYVDPEKFEVLCLIYNHSVPLVRNAVVYCACCKLKNAHNTIFCPFMFTHEDRMRAVSSNELCVGCCDISCSEGRTAHINHITCFFCGANDHVDNCCDDPNTWYLVDKELCRTWKLFAALGLNSLKSLKTLCNSLYRSPIDV